MGINIEKIRTCGFNEGLSMPVHGKVERERDRKVCYS
jgi:hypothetical protein